MRRQARVEPREGATGHPPTRAHPSHTAHWPLERTVVTITTAATVTLLGVRKSNYNGLCGATRFLAVHRLNGLLCRRPAPEADKSNTLASTSPLWNVYIYNLAVCLKCSANLNIADQSKTLMFQVHAHCE
mgnify:CR=1 FL=1